LPFRLRVVVPEPFQMHASRDILTPAMTIRPTLLAVLCVVTLPSLGAGGAAAERASGLEKQGVGLIQQHKQLELGSDEVVEDSEATTVQRIARLGTKVSVRACAAEFVAMALFVFVGCGSAMSVAKEPGWLLQVSLTFGFAITVLAYTVGHHSGGQINCAVTFGLMLYGALPVAQGLCNVVAQLLGAVVGAAVLKLSFPQEKDLTGGLGTNGISEGWSKAGVLVAEFVGTFLLMYVVFETAINEAAKPNAALAPLAIGLAVFLAHSVMIPIDGCSINPTRSFGPALVQSMAGAGAEPFKDMWIFWVGPLAGSAAAAGLYTLMTV